MMSDWSKTERVNASVAEITVLNTIRHFDLAESRAPLFLYRMTHVLAYDYLCSWGVSTVLSVAYEIYKDSCLASFVTQSALLFGI